VTFPNTNVLKYNIGL